MSGLRETRKSQARTYILAHPDESKEQQAVGVGCSVSLIAQQRAALIAEGLLAPSRKNIARDSTRLAQNWAGKTDAPDAPAAPAGPSPPTATLLDHAAMTAMAEMGSLDGLDDEEIRRRMHQQCVRFMFDPRLHPDTRMSASQMWEKLKERAKIKDLGPGSPVTFEEGVARLADLFEACGPKMVLAAVNVAFNVQESPDAAHGDEASPAGGPAEAPSPA